MEAIRAVGELGDVPAGYLFPGHACQQAGRVLLEAGVGHAVKVVVAGDTFELWVDAELQSQDTDASYGSGKVGVWTWATMASFDNFTVSGAGIADNGTPVEPQGKLATAWGRMKDTR